MCNKSLLDFLQFQLFYDFTRHVVKVDWRRWLTKCTFSRPFEKFSGCVLAWGAAGAFQDCFKITKNRHSPTKPIGTGRTLAAFPHSAQRVTAHTYLLHPYLVGTSPLPYLSTRLSQFSLLVVLTIIAHLEGTRAHMLKGHIWRVSFSFTARFNLLERAIFRP